VRSLEKFFGAIFLFLLKLTVVKQVISPDSIDFPSIKNILVIIRHQMGDMLCATPMIRSLKARCPGALITIVTKSSANFSEVFKNDPSVADNVMEYENGIENFFNIIKELRDKKFDLAVVPSPVVFSVTNHLIAYYSKARIRVGAASNNALDNSAEFLLNVKSDFLWESKKVHMIERNLDLIRQIGIEPAEKRININISSANREFAEKFFEESFPDKSKPVIGFHPGAAKPGNVWDPLKYAELAYRLSQKFNSYIFISEGPDDASYVNRMASELENKFNYGTFKRHHGVLMNNVALIDKLRLFVTNDTGIMHLASGLNTPVAALFGPTKAYIWGPIGSKKYSLQSSSDNINDITTEKVFEVCTQIL
jgi:ADP-heptose:LPS heptosyltransferase